MRDTILSPWDTKMRDTKSYKKDLNNVMENVKREHQKQTNKQINNSVSQRNRTDFSEEVKCKTTAIQSRVWRKGKRTRGMLGKKIAGAKA